MTFIPNGSERSDSASTDALLERRTFVGAACAAAVATVLPGTLHAQSVYPSKAVTLIVPNPPGGDPTFWPAFFPSRLLRRSASQWWWTTVQVPVA